MTERSSSAREIEALARERVVALLRARRDRDGGLPEVAVRGAAADLGCSPRSVRRWLKDGLPAGRKPASVTLDETMRAAYVGWHGNASAAYRELRSSGTVLPSLRTVQRAFAREMRASERAAIMTGEAGIREHALYLRWVAGHRNEVWQGDHKLLDVLVLPPRAARPVRPWSTMFIDAYSRAVVGWAISLRPSAAEVLAALRDAMGAPNVDGPVLGGVPERLRIDHGLEFCADAVSCACLALGVELTVAESYTPQEKGKIERLHHTCVQTFLCGLPGFTGGRRDRRGRLQDPRAPLGLEQFVARFAGWVIDYDHRPHSELCGRTPAEVFALDATPLRVLSAVEARALLAARKEVMVRRYGITHNTHRYIAVELHDLVGETVQIAFAPHDDRSIEVYWRGEWLCTALPQETLSSEQQVAVIKARRAYAKELRRRQRTATRASEPRLAPMTSTEPAATDVTLISRHTPRPPLLGSAAAQARTDLLLPAGAPRARRAQPG